MTIGRTIEILSCSVIGFIFASLGIINFLKKYSLQTIIVCIYIIYFLINYSIFINIKGFSYNGFKMFFISICLFIISALFPSEKKNNEIIIKIIKQITNFTAGIYYTHVPINRFMKPYIKIVKDGTLKGCIIVYLICYFICFIGSAIFGKSKLRNLFV